ncbi:hypothetical protein QBC33DRAFT_528146 [Phialemonium atrogriseum]|uniref:EF-hand domain-containing protein n=1 Tax=Phialemonium atrogriseum TaxID=1093897 RepID=A0AAJ0C5S4_9PEZI|nr:uncharacterized protein QBC33DRAFT_528146 [Phialemonium atrogriseum]KAK1770476.1 hypothetical protein QBC33DRAFT_528146 [Phialemonium atrogriseum]
MKPRLATPAARIREQHREKMPAKRRPAAAAKPGAKAWRSKLAKEHNITAAEEAEISEAFGLFSDEAHSEQDRVIPIGDVRRAMIALGIPPRDKTELAEFTSILDPDDEGYAPYPAFVAICALKMHARDQGSEAHVREVDEAFSLFSGSGALGGSGGGGGPAITMAQLRRVAATLKEEVGDDVLRDMILEANGGAGVGKGVNKDEFESVMRRAGVWR